MTDFPLEFTQKLKMLHDISIELSNADSLETLYRRTIELGRQELGFDRLGLLLLGPDGKSMVGTFGTDPHGKLRDERDFHIKEIDPDIMAVLHNRERIGVWPKRLLFDNAQVVGEGWNVMAALWDGAQSIGWLASDNLITQQPIQSEQVELLALYGRVIAHLITKKRFEDVLQESEVLFKGVFDQAANPIILTDQAWRIMRLNQSAEKLFLLSEAESVGQPITTYLKLPAVAPAPGSRQTVEASRTDSTRFPAEVAISELALASRTIHIVLVQDLTELELKNRLMQERELFRLELAKERELSELRSRFISNVSHEIRTPLASIKAASSNLEYYWERMTPDQRKARFGIINDQVAHMTTLLDDVLAMGRFELGIIPFDPAPLRIHRFLEACVRQFQDTESTADSVQLTSSVAARQAVVVADVGLLQQAISNLILYALKFSTAESTVEVSLSSTGETVRVNIRNTGNGIPPLEADRVFQPFQRPPSDGSARGTGLGLAIVKRIIDLHHGTIGVNSQLAEGTTFTLTFPQQPSS